MATKRVAKAVSASLDFAFFHFLWQFYQANRGSIRSHYKELTRKFLDFNNPDKNPKAFLRQPQFEALETYSAENNPVTSPELASIYTSE